MSSKFYSELFNHIVRERIISCLRNRIFLGNTIGCDVRKINHTIGLRYIFTIFLERNGTFFFNMIIYLFIGVVYNVYGDLFE